jgi:hypothetical protein
MTDYALKDYALRNDDGTYKRRYFEPGFRVEDLTDEEREEIKRTATSIGTSIAVAVEHFTNGAQQILEALEAVAAPYRGWLQSLGPDQTALEEMVKYHDRRAHSRAYRGVKQYKKVRTYGF